MKRSILIIIALLALLVPSSGVSASGGQSPWAETVVTLANQERRDRDIPELTVSPLLEKAAALKLADMEKNGYFAHTSSAGLTPWSFMDQAGYGYRYAGENLAIHYTDPVSEHSAWMKSEKHCQNILDPRFREIGIAVKKVFFEGRETMLTVEMFGTIPGREVQTKLTKADALSMCQGGLPTVSGVSTDQGTGNASPEGRIALFSKGILPDAEAYARSLSGDLYGVAEILTTLVFALAQLVAVVLSIRLLLARETREGVYLS